MSNVTIITPSRSEVRNAVRSIRKRSFLRCDLLAFMKMPAESKKLKIKISNTLLALVTNGELDRQKVLFHNDEGEILYNKKGNPIEQFLFTKTL